MLTLSEAIDHALETANDKSVCKSCREEHRQLANWLKELKDLKSKNKVTKIYTWEDTHPNYDKVLKTNSRGCGTFSVVYKYTDENGVRHWKTGWYSNRSNFIDDFRVNFHGTGD